MFSAFKVLKSLIIRQEGTSTPSEIEIVPGGTAGTKLTITSSQTSNTTVTMPSDGGNVVTDSSSQTLTNKTINADNNTITNIDNNDIKALAGIDATKIGGGNVSSAEFDFLDGVTSAIQTQINAKADASSLTAHTGASSGVHGVTGAVVGTTDTQTLTNKTLTSPVINTPTGITKSDVGLGNVDNTSDATKNSATATLTNKTIDGASNTITNVSLTTGVTGTLPIANGGTNGTSATTAFNNLAPTTTKGDLITRDSTNNIRIGVGTDGQVLVADSAQTSGLKWSTVSGVKNYILNDGAESNTTGWATYSDAAASRPVDGTGGTANITWSRTTTNPLRGTGSFQLVKDAANRQGQGVSYDFIIDRADRAKVLQIQFDYEIVSGTYSGGTSSTDSDLIAYIYDVTNAQLIEPNQFKIDGAVIGTEYKGNCTFQSNSNSTSYRLILHTATTSASAYTINFDGFVVGPQIVTQGALDSDWVSYTPTFTGFGTVSGVEAQYRRVGDSVQIKGKFTSGTSTAVEARWSLPTGLTSADTTKIPSIQSLGNMAVYNHATTTENNTLLIEPSVGYMTFGIQSNTTAGLAKQNGNIIAASGQTLSIGVVTIPIQGWGTSQVLSSETDTRVIAALVTGAPANVTANNPIIFPTVVRDTHGAYNATTGRYIAPVSGFYEVSAFQSCSVGANTTTTVYLDGVNQNPALGFMTSALGIGWGTTVVFANAGQLIDVRNTQNTTGYSASSTGLSIRRISGPSAIAASETVACRYTDATASLSATNSKVTYTTKDYDTHGSYSSGVFTCPVSGKYNICASAQISGTFSTGNNSFIAIYKNGTLVSETFTTAYGSLPTLIPPPVIDTLSLVVGDQIEIRASSQATTPSIPSTAIRNRLEIYKVGN